MSLDWARDGAGWPNRQFSRYVDAGGVRWHVQRAGAGPAVVLLHGTGAATHSWAGLLPLLAREADVIVPDLPGHGFTTPRRSGLLSLPWMAGAVAALLETLAVQPALLVGHSAGAAVAARMVLDGPVKPARGIVAINGALLPFAGHRQPLAAGLAKLLFLNPLVPRLMAWRAQASGAAVAKLLANTGSRLSADQVASYRRLFANSGHVDAALGMMANWDLPGLALERLAVPLTLLAADGDRAIPPEVARQVAARVPHARVERLAGLGHLAHEEAPARVAPVILRALAVASGSATAPAAPPAAPPPAASGREA